MGIGSWAGMWFALGIPIIAIMYLLKRKFIDTPVPSHLLWRRVLENTEANRPWQKLRNRLLMWLQILAAALLAFALMRPFLWGEAGTGGQLIVIADVSASMTARSGGESGGAAGTRLDEMKRRILEDTRRADGGLTLIAMGSNPQVSSSRTDGRGAWEQAVEALKPDYGRTAYRETLSLASAVAQGQKDARIVIYTDNQWNERTDDLALDAPVEIRGMGETGSYRNAAIEQFGVDDGERAARSAVGVVANTGGGKLELRAELSGDGRPLGAAELTLEPGERRTVAFKAAGEARTYRLSLAGIGGDASPPDDYAADNDAFAFAKSGQTPSVLLLSDGNLFLEKALRLSGAEVTRMDRAAGKEDKAPPLPGGKFDLIVAEDGLPGYAQSGDWNDLLRSAALWIIGGKADDGQPGSRRVEVSVHPVTRYLSLSEPYFGALTAGKPAGLQTIVTIGQRPAIAAGTENGRRELWFGFNLQDGDLPLSSEFPVLVSSSVSWLTGGGGGGLGRVVSGAAVDVPIAAGAENALWRPMQGTAFTEGAGETAAVRASGTGADSQQSAPAGSPSPSQPAPNIPGLYAFEQSGQGLEDAPVYLLDVRPDLSESAAPSPETPEFAAAPGGETADAGTDTQGRSRLPLTIPLAALIAVIMLTEWGVYRRGRSI
ncbi:VWA domain-containing protein [Saccharibacillus sp. CPCC 101409]|uniref:vWA domain-containing protein n=1 Tax=Saccharibacillus sp. CPCC 101409 TaxID=3058041 RepID=UPI002670EE5B|nr:VWA domain-containing protein [Saccharibacillus sp. CPCC 101409]MDO3408659.1 VWA domain-containing protein [Saccharibacillus sp. CPCC 101409]